MSAEAIGKILKKQLASYGILDLTQKTFLANSIKNYLLNTIPQIQAKDILEIKIKNNLLVIRTSHAIISNLIKLKEVEILNDFQSEFEKYNIKKISYHW